MFWLAIIYYNINKKYYFYVNFFYNVIFLIPDEVVTSDDESVGSLNTIFLSLEEAEAESGDSEESGNGSIFFGSSGTSRIDGFILIGL